ncbi:uncharacterized protein LOC113847124 [Abrus precatorius]|uniref:Uncharacterized protein LOC113847124 n=1 Tax=Abrus precatorius TaxID=3816 RepID=A0A8B8JK64_ABRPR|nr:uncharacterized protein LOC113847124 [Abrus precatorius]
MGTAVLRSHDCLQGRFLPNDALAIATSHARSRRNSYPNPNFNSSPSHNRHRKRSPIAAFQANYHDRDRRRPADRSAVKSPAAANLVMGQVKILKRGEKLTLENDDQVLAVPSENSNLRVNSEVGLDLLLGSTDRLGPDPLTLQKQIRVSDSKEGIYAGSAFVASPHPSSVPVPGFLGRNGAATSDLRRLLRLDME